MESSARANSWRRLRGAWGRNRFPLGDGAGNDPKQWVRHRPCYGCKSSKPCWSARRELAGEVRPFICELPARDLQRLDRTASADLAGVEAIASAVGLGVDLPQVGRDVPIGGWCLKKARELGVMLVASRPAREHRLGKQALTP